jgi:hypothetical protein
MHNVLFFHRACLERAIVSIRENDAKYVRYSSKLVCVCVYVKFASQDTCFIQLYSITHTLSSISPEFTHTRQVAAG